MDTQDSFTLNPLCAQHSWTPGMVNAQRYGCACLTGGAHCPSSLSYWALQWGGQAIYANSASQWGTLGSAPMWPQSMCSSHGMSSLVTSYSSSPHQSPSDLGLPLAPYLLSTISSFPRMASW